GADSGTGPRTTSTSPLRTADRVDARGGEQRVRVHGRTVAGVPLDVVVGPARVAGGAHVADDVARVDVSERPGRAEVGVVDVAVGAEHPYLETAELAPSGRGVPVEGREDRRARGRHHVVALVHVDRHMRE